MARHQDRKVGFKSVQLFKDQTLGIGSYGAVCQAKCDDLLCAAKILHPVLFSATAQLQVSPKHKLPIKRFEQECEFLSTIRHPNIVQYLCMHQDPDTGLPVLLMELMDESLTHFLERSPQPIVYHIQVNISHDITLALSFLHSNGIIHRDLSSNNVLLRGSILAKVTDFGMAKLGDLNPQATRDTFTRCPGTDVYMPPEAVQDEPVYTEKIDCFSFGVIIIQISTQLFPKPGNRWQEVEINHLGLPQGQVTIRSTEINRRRNHISQVEPNHPLLPIALNCLKDKDIERPSAQQLCERVASLKERPDYSESVMIAAQQQSQRLGQQPQQGESRDEKQLEQLRGQLQQLQQYIKEKEKLLKQQLERCEQEKAKLEKELCELKRTTTSGLSLTWKEGKKTPLSTKSWGDTVVDDSRVYIRNGIELWIYDINGKEWSRLPDSKCIDTSLQILNGLPTTIGGASTTKDPESTLFSLIEDSSNKMWTDKTFPSMPTKRKCVTAVCTGTVLIVAGGHDGEKELTTVEVLNIKNHQWSIAIDVPESLQCHSATVYGDQLYMLGGQHNCDPTKSVYTCSVSALLQTCISTTLVRRTLRSIKRVAKWPLSLTKGISGQSSDQSSVQSSGGADVWSQLPDLPVTGSTCVTFCGQLLAVGGTLDFELTTAVYKYNPSTSSSSWNKISDMMFPRVRPFAAVLPDNQLMVVGGEVDKRWLKDHSDSEFGSFNVLPTPETMQFN